MRTINDTISQPERKGKSLSLESKDSKLDCRRLCKNKKENFGWTHYTKFKAIQKFNDPIQKIKIIL